MAKSNKETYVGFWPTRNDFCHIDLDSLDECNLTDEETQKSIRDTILSITKNRLEN